MAISNLDNITERIELSMAPSENLLREFMRLAEETARRDKLSVESIFADEQITKLIADETKSTRKARQKKLRQILEEKRYPEMTQIRNELSELTSEMIRTHGIRVSLPEDLEGDTITLSVQAKSEKGLQQLGEQLIALSQSDQTKRLFSLLKGEVSR